MRKFLPISLLGLLMMAIWVLPAMADVNVLADITKTKTIDVIETITITKTLELDVTVTAVLNGAAEANTLVNQRNEVGLVDVELITLNAAIVGSINENTGIVGVNQDAGNMNNQGNAYAIAETDVAAFADAQAAVDQVTAGNLVDTIDAVKNVVLSESVNANVGIVGVNQSVGNMNSQANAFALAAGLTEGDLGGVVVALAESDLGQINLGNQVIELDTTKNARVDGIGSSIIGNTGVVNVNQSAGNMGNQANSVSISAAVAQ